MNNTIHLIPFEKCPVCAGDMVTKEVYTLLQCGINTATLKVNAEVCLHCGEPLYSEETVRCFEHIMRDEVKDFKPMGQSFRVNNCDLETLHNFK